MDTEKTHLPAIILVDRDQFTLSRTREWLGKGRFRSWEALNVFDALGGIADFTLRDRPDLILIRVGSIGEDYKLLADLLPHGKANGPEHTILALCLDGSAEDCLDLIKGDLPCIDAYLEDLIPPKAPHSSVAASRPV